MDGKRFRLKRLQYRHQQSLFQRGTRFALRQHGDTAVLNRRVHQQRRNTGAQVAADGHAQAFAFRGQEVPGLPREKAVVQAVMLRQFFGADGRAVLCQIRRRGAEHRSTFPQPAGNHAGFGVVGNAHGDINALSHQADRVVIYIQLDT